MESKNDNKKRRIAFSMNVSVGTVQKILNDCNQKGIVVVKKQFGTIQNNVKLLVDIVATSSQMDYLINTYPEIEF
jgi:predicted transcriptional regulator